MSLLSGVFATPADDAVSNSHGNEDVPATITEWEYNLIDESDGEGSERSAVIDTPPPSVEGGEPCSPDFAVGALLNELKLANANHQLLLKNFERAQLDARERDIQDKERMYKLIQELQEDHRRLHEKESKLQNKELELNKREQMINDSEQSAAALNAASFAEIETKMQVLRKLEQALERNTKKLAEDRKKLNKQQSKLNEVKTTHAERGQSFEDKVRQVFTELESELKNKVGRLEQRERTFAKCESESAANGSTADGSNKGTKKVEFVEDEARAKDSLQPKIGHGRAQAMAAIKNLKDGKKSARATSLPRTSFEYAFLWWLNKHLDRKDFAELIGCNFDHITSHALRTDIEIWLNVVYHNIISHMKHSRIVLCLDFPPNMAHLCFLAKSNSAWPVVKGAAIMTWNDFREMAEFLKRQNSREGSVELFALGSRVHRALTRAGIIEGEECE